MTEAECTPCLGGYYCPMPGLVTPYDFCAAGYFCKQYANISAPDQGKWIRVNLANKVNLRKCFQKFNYFL